MIIIWGIVLRGGFFIKQRRKLLAPQSTWPSRLYDVLPNKMFFFTHAYTLFYTNNKTPLECLNVLVHNKNILCFLSLYQPLHVRKYFWGDMTPRDTCNGWWSRRVVMVRGWSHARPIQKSERQIFVSNNKMSACNIYI